LIGFSRVQEGGLPPWSARTSLEKPPAAIRPVPLDAEDIAVDRLLVLPLRLP
jgi:hypothetical protein